MYIEGTGFTKFSAKIKPDFRPETVLAIQWNQLSSGNFVATDRGSTSDVYDVDIRLYGNESDMISFVNNIELNRTAGSNVLTLSGFNNQEHIFGADIDYTGNITATAKLEKRGQKTWKGFEQKLRLSCLSPSFVGGAGALPLLRLLNIGYEADSERRIIKFDSYSRVFSYCEHESDTGNFMGVFTFTDEEMIQIRRLIAVSRGTTFSIPGIYGVNYPWGWRSSAYPISVKIISFEDMGMYSMSNNSPIWAAKMTLAEQI